MFIECSVSLPEILTRGLTFSPAEKGPTATPSLFSRQFIFFKHRQTQQNSSSAHPWLQLPGTFSPLPLSVLPLQCFQQESSMLCSPLPNMFPVPLFSGHSSSLSQGTSCSCPVSLFPSNWQWEPFICSLYHFPDWLSRPIRPDFQSFRPQVLFLISQLGSGIGAQVLVLLKGLVSPCDRGLVNLGNVLLSTPVHWFWL